MNCDWGEPVDGYIACQRDGCRNRMRWRGDMPHRATCQAGPKPARPDYTTCRHRIDWSDTIAHASCGCPSDRKHGQQTMVAVCELYGLTTPLARRTKEGHRACHGCGDFEAE